MGEENLALKEHMHSNYIDINKIADITTTTDTSMVLSAPMGKNINDMLENLKEMYWQYLNPGFMVKECTPSGSGHDYFPSYFPYKFYIKSLDENSCITLDSRLNVLKRTGNMEAIGGMRISFFKDYYVSFTYHESHGTYWYTQSESLMDSGCTIYAAKKFKLIVSTNYDGGEFSDLNGNLQNCEPMPGQTGWEYDNYYVTRIVKSVDIN